MKPEFEFGEKLENIHTHEVFEVGIINFRNGTFYYGKEDATGADRSSGIALRKYEEPKERKLYAYKGETVVFYSTVLSSQFAPLYPDRSLICDRAPEYDITFKEEK